MLTRPRALRSNAHIAVLAASSPTEPAHVDIGVQALERRGFRVTVANNVSLNHRGYLAGPDDARLEQLNQYFRSDEYDAFFFARGGYGAMRILDGLDYAALRDNPRPVVGFSDVTAIHQAMAVHSNVGGFHGPMIEFDFYPGLSSARD